MTFTSPLPRTEPPRTNAELAALNSWLNYNRATLLSKLDGLTEEQAGQPMRALRRRLRAALGHR